MEKNYTLNQSFGSNRNKTGELVKEKQNFMYINIFLWIIISIFIGIVGYLMEVNKKKHLWSNVVAAFVGVFPSAFIIHFIIWPEAGDGVNVVAAIVSMFFGLLAVKLEDYVFMR